MSKYRPILEFRRFAGCDLARKADAVAGAEDE
jgi:hypothetical protein